MKKISIKTITVTIAVLILCSGLFALQNKAFNEREARLKEIYAQWSVEDLEVEREIKEYIDNIDWAYYTNQAVEGLLNPAVTAEDINQYFGVNK